jgi:hypothetical protein
MVTDTLIRQTASALLPPNATPLEIAIADVAPRPLLDELADAPRLLKSNPPDSVVPWLAAEWFLADFIKYFPDARALIDAGLPWLMERGTAAAVKRVLSWLGMHNVMLEEDGSKLQIDTGSSAAPEQLEDILHLVNASIPAHVELYRLYHQYDLRPIGISQDAALDNGLLSDDSGVWVTVGDERVKLSFGSTISRYLDASGGRKLWEARRDREFAHVFYEDRARLSVWRLDSEIVPNRNVVMGQLITLFNSIGVRDPWQLGRHLNIARSALDLDEDVDPFGDLNCGFAGGADIEYNPFVLSGSELSNHDNDLRHFFIDERTSDDRTLSGILALDPVATCPVTQTRCYCSHTRRDGSGETWHGAWDARSWYPTGIQTPVWMTESTEPLDP